MEQTSAELEPLTRERNAIGVWERNESFAACLGAKLTGSRLLKGFEKFFEGPIKILSDQPFAQPITWLDICNFAKENPNDFVLRTLPDSSRCCQFFCKGAQVEIIEDDWRFILSGALSRIPLEHPLEEDETAELATIDILEQRASALWRRADEVAARSRILHHRLGQRRQDIMRRRKSHEDMGATGARFHSINQPARPPSRGPSYDLHADLMQQFAAAAEPASGSRSTSGAGLSQGQASPAVSAAPQQQHQALRLFSSGRASGGSSDTGPQADMFRPLITQKIDKLVRGDTIQPPCDRCRRLRLQCVKHLTACQGCTKKHAKCSWKSISDDEVAKLRRETGEGLGIGGGPASDADTEMATPESRAMDITTGSVVSGEGSRPSSRTGGAEPVSSAAADRYGPKPLSFLPSPTGRIELPPMRIRAPPQGHQGPGPGRASTPQSQSSVSQFSGERSGFHASNPPSR